MYEFLEKRRFGFSIRSLLESLALGAFYLGVMFYFHPDDPCFVHDHTAITIFVIAVVTLFYGYGGGIPFILLLALFMKLYYHPFPTESFLIDLVFMLLFSEFHHFWTRTHREKEIKADYYEKKFNELATAFYALKVSHDQLERNYVIKPMSLRNAMAEILKKSDASESESFTAFLTLLEKNFNIHSGLVAWGETDGGFVTMAETEGVELDRQDPLLLQALQRQEPVYISEHIEKKSRYVAVLPAIVNGDVKGLICIAEMPFMSFNKDNLVSISVLFDYFALERLRNSTMLKCKLDFPYGTINFRYEIFRLETLVKEYGVNSTLVLLHCLDDAQRIVLDQTIRENLRSLEHFEILRTSKKGEVLAILFPFAGHSTVEGFLERIKEILQKKETELCAYTFFTMKEIPQVIKYLEGRNDA